MGGNDMNILQLHKVSKSYRSGTFFKRTKPAPILLSVSLAIETGECIGLVGRSGSGKSTLGRIALGIETADQGEIYLLGQKISSRLNSMPKHLRRTVQVVFQDGYSSCNPRWTAGKIIGEPLGNFERLTGAETRMRVFELLDQVGLTENDAEKYPSHFSGGQLQRVCIARALAAKPKLIILDEAVSSLDMIVQARILNLLEQLRQSTGMAFLFITHDLRLIRKFCSRAFILHKGSLEPFPVHLNTSLPSAVQELADALLPAMPGTLSKTRNNELIVSSTTFDHLAN
jgi:nickel transport system ATP-binding protein